MTPLRAIVPVLVAVILIPAQAAAHPRVVGTAPSAEALLAGPPHVVVVRLDERADPVGGGLTVKGPDGRDVASGPVVVTGAMLARAVNARARGSYVVEWSVIGDDSQPAHGSFLFSVGAPTRAAAPGTLPGSTVVVALGRWLSLLGFALGFGVVLAALVSGGMTVRCWRLVSAGVILMIVAEPVALAGQIATLAPARLLDIGLTGDVLLTRYGHLVALRLGGALGLWALAGAVRPSSSRVQWLIPATGVPVAFVYAASTHRISGLPVQVSIILAAIHIAAFAVWLGSIVVVAHSLSRGRRLRPVAVLAALVLVITGSGLALAHLQGPADLIDTAYGAALGIKIALVAVAFALGAAVRRRGELVAVLLVLAAASVLVSLVPPI
ncbi:MAG: copper resistance CopC family protein [Thermoleophilia bacterium]